MKTSKNAVIAMMSHRCPACRSSSMYVHPRIYTWKNIGDMHRLCPVCNTNLLPETGFYFGAAYVSWALTVALWVTVLVALKILDALALIEFGFLTHPVTFLTTGSVATLVLFPYLFRVSRSIWAHLFIRKKA